MKKKENIGEKLKIRIHVYYCPLILYRFSINILLSKNNKLEE
jgi:hypothetical protein